MYGAVREACGGFGGPARKVVATDALDTGLIGQPAADHALHDRQHRANGIRFAGEQEPQGAREVQHTLPHRTRAEHVVHQMPRALGHAPRATARAEPALLARERHQPLGMTVLAHHPQEAMHEHAAAQVRLERLAHVDGQRAVQGRELREEVRVMRLHQGVQQRAPGVAVGVGRCGRARARCGADGVRRPAFCRHGLAQHGALPCGDGRSLFGAVSCSPMDVCPARG